MIAMIRCIVLFLSVQVSAFGLCQQQEKNSDGRAYILALEAKLKVAGETLFRAVQLADAKKLSVAEDVCRQAIEEFASCAPGLEADAVVVLAEILLERGVPAEAAFELRRLGPTQTGLRSSMNLAIALVRMNHAEAALSILGKELESKNVVLPDSLPKDSLPVYTGGGKGAIEATALLLRAINQRFLDDNRDRAMKDLQAAVRLVPENPGVAMQTGLKHMERGLIKRDRSEYDMAKKQFQVVLKHGSKKMVEMAKKQLEACETQIKLRGGSD